MIKNLLILYFISRLFLASADDCTAPGNPDEFRLQITKNAIAKVLKDNPEYIPKDSLNDPRKAKEFEEQLLAKIGSLDPKRKTSVTKGTRPIQKGHSVREVASIDTVKETITTHTEVLKRKEGHISSLKARLKDNPNSAELKQQLEFAINERREVENILGEAINDRAFLEKSLGKTRSGDPNQPMAIIVYDQPPRSFGMAVNLARSGQGFVTKSSHVKPKSAPEGSLIEGMIPRDQTLSKLNDTKDIIKYNAKVEELKIKKGDMYGFVQPNIDGKLPFYDSSPEILSSYPDLVRKGGIVMIPEGHPLTVTLKGKEVQVIADISIEGKPRIVLSDTDVLMMAKKKDADIPEGRDNTTQWDQDLIDSNWGDDYSGEHKRVSEDINSFYRELFAEELGVPRTELVESVRPVNHSASHSWQNENAPKLPGQRLIMYENGKKYILEADSPNSNDHLWEAIINNEEKGYHSVVNCQWTGPSFQTEKVMALLIQAKCN